MSDLISRQATIKAIDDYTKGKPLYEYPYQLIEVIRNVPSAEKIGEWIPCKERLPELDKEVWVTVDDMSKIAWLKERKTTFGFIIQEWWTHDGWIFQFEEITAWQPLYRPQPYKGE